MFSKSSTFDKCLEKATSQLLLEPDWDSTLQLCDCVRQGDVQPKHVLGSIKRKIAADNPHVSLYALQVLESCVKNCGAIIHDELATKETMEFMKDQVKSRSDPVKAKILELIQVWSHAFRNEPSYKVVQDTFHLMKMEGYTFPTLKEADAMFTAEKAPEWKEGDCCNRCRSKFGVVNRQHHCRNCGEVFCGKCSSKSSIIPKFGIEREVRVCDSCYDIINKGGSAKKSEDDLPLEYLNSPLSKQSQVSTPAKKSEQELQEEDELALALALSQSEHENKEKERERLRKNYGIYGGGSDQSSSSTKTSVYSQPASVSAPMIDTADMDPELARYLNRNYWQQKSDHKTATTTVATTTPSAPVVMSESIVSGGRVVQEVYQNGAIDDDDQEQFLHALKSSVEIFVNRMKSNSQRGRSIANDSSVQSLFNVISNMHPQLMKHTHEQEELRAHFESLQDKLAQLRDAREALDALREDYREKKRREMEEQERIRQIQMAQKLEVMRQKKHEYLEMQRQLALQRLQEQEREMQMRLEQQKQLTQYRQMQNYGYPQPYAQGQMPGMPQGLGMMPTQAPGMPPQQVPGMPPQQIPGMPAQQTFSPENSPIHQLHQKPGGYTAQPMAQQGVAPLQNQPNVGIGQSQPNIGGPMVTSQMYGNQPPTQPGYSQAGAAPYQSLSATAQPSGGYNPDPGVMPPAGQSYQSMPYNPTTSPPNSLPSQGGPITQGYSSMPPAADYQSFNMQGMASALPQQTQPSYTAPPQQYMGGPPPPPQGQQPQYQQGAPPQQQQLPPQQQQLPPQQQQLPPQQQSHEAELISFD